MSAPLHCLCLHRLTGLNRQCEPWLTTSGCLTECLLGVQQHLDAWTLSYFSVMRETNRAENWTSTITHGIQGVCLPLVTLVGITATPEVALSVRCSCILKDSILLKQKLSYCRCWVKASLFSLNIKKGKAILRWRMQSWPELQAAAEAF